MSSALPAEQRARAEFSGQLAAFDREVQDFFTAVTLAVQRATAAFVSGDQSETARMAEGTVLSRSILARVEGELEQAFARQAPVGTDLRLMITVLRVVPQLERCIELARHIAERARFADQFPADVLAAFAEMGALATAMWEKAAEAWQNRDPQVAAALDRDDDDLDVRSDEVAERLRQMEASPVAAMEGRLIVRFYERLGDHAVHASQRIIDLAVGHDPAQPCTLS